MPVQRCWAHEKVACEEHSRFHHCRDYDLSAALSSLRIQDWTQGSDRGMMFHCTVMIKEKRTHIWLEESVLVEIVSGTSGSQIVRLLQPLTLVLLRHPSDRVQVAPGSGEMSSTIVCASIPSDQQGVI